LSYIGVPFDVCLDFFIHVQLKIAVVSVNKEDQNKGLNVVLSLVMVELCSLLADAAAVRIAGEILAARTDVNIHIGNSVFGLPVCSVNCSVSRQLAWSADVIFPLRHLARRFGTWVSACDQKRYCRNNGMFFKLHIRKYRYIFYS
jgi:hypothetical protein